MTTKKDIVSRLRECDQGLLEEYQEPELGDIVTDCSSIAEAANVIEQLREERDQLREERDYARRERDEARREVCKSEQYCVDRSREEATLRGWDCFKEDNHNA